MTKIILLLFPNSSYFFLYVRRLLHRTEDQLRNQSHSGNFNLPSKPKTEESERRRKKEGSLKDFANVTSQSENKTTENSENETTSLIGADKSLDITKDLPSTSCIVNHPKPGGSKEEPFKPNDTRPTLIPKEFDPPFDINDVQYVSNVFGFLDLRCSY